MTIQTHKDIIIARVESMVNHYSQGDLKKCQGDYDYIRGYCEGANINMSNAIEGSIKHLMKQCVGIKDTAKYNAYLKAI